ncbi:MAG: transglutaminase domain-containing protein [Lysinibacillus sp.]
MRLSKLHRGLMTSSLTLSILLGIQGVAGAEESTSTKGLSTQADLILPSDVVYVEDLPKYYSNNLGTFNSIEALMPKVTEALANFETKITFTYTGDVSNFQSEFLNARNTMFVQPGNDYIHGTVKSTMYSYQGLGNNTYSFTMNFSYFGTAEQEQYVTQRVKEIASELTKPGMTDFEKVLAVNDYVVTNTVYHKNPSTSPHHAYALLKEGKGVCQAYALVTYRLLKEMGIEARYVVGYAGEAHAWNSVKIDGVWYHLDTTWNDPSFNGGDLGGGVSYKYFLVTTEQLKKDHSWEEENSPAASDTRYSYLHEILMGDIQGDEIYYSNPNSNYNIYKMNYKTGYKELVLARHALYIAVHNDTVYYSDTSNNKYLTAYNLITKQRETIVQKAVTALHVKEGVLHYKIGTANYKYELPLSAIEQEVRNVELKLLSLSEMSTKEELDAAQDMYDNLTDEQKASIKNLNRLTQLKELYPINLAKANEFAQLVPSYSESSTRTQLQEIISKYDALTPGQQALVSNKEKVLTFKGILDEQNAKITAVEEAIKKLSTKSKTYLEDITKIRTAYDALSEELRKEVVNYGNFTSVESAAQAAIKAYDAIEALTGESVADIIAARQAYTDTPKAVKKYVTNVKKLTTLERTVKNEITAIKQIDLIDPTSSKFISQVKKAKTAFNKKGLKKELVSNADKFNTLAPQADVLELINKLKPTSSKFIAELTAAKEAFDKLTENKYVTNADKLTEGLEKIQPAQAVIQKIAAVSGDSAQVVIDARNDYNALDKVSKKYVTNYKHLTQAEARLKNVLNTIKLIDAIDPTSKKFTSQVTAAKKAYDKTGAYKGSVTNAQSLETILPQADVFDKIAKLKPSSSKYIEQVTAAKTAFDALEYSTFVTNASKLTEAVEAIKPAQAVVAQIEALKGDSIEAVVAARAEFNKLDKTSKKYVTNEKALKAFETKMKAPIKAIALIEEVKALDESAATYVKKAAAMKKAYNSLSDDNKALVTNAEDFTSLVALYEIKNAKATKKWGAVAVSTFEDLKIEGVTTENLEKIIAGFNALPKGTGTSTIEEITSNVAKFIEQ